MEDRDRIIDRIRKVMAMTSSPNENEAASAAQRAQELLALYNIDISEVNSAQAKEKSGNIQQEKFSSKTKARHTMLRGACARMYFCEYYFMRADGGQMFNVFVGEPHNTTVAKLMSEYLISAVWKMAKQSAKQYPPSERSRYRNSFLNAAACHIAQRIYERIEMSKKQQTVTSDGRNLPALASLYDQSANRIAKFYQDQGIRLRVGKSRMKSTHAAGSMDGREAGNRVSLDPQLNPGSATKRLQ